MDYEEKRLKDRKKRKRMMSLILALLFIHLILNVISFPLIHENQITGNVILNNSINLQERLTQRQCFRKYHEWTFDWEGYNEVDASAISPKFRLYNEESRKGTYYVEFGFFDQSLYDFNQYRNKPYSSVMKELPWSAASMRSDNITVHMGPKENRLITSYTEKIDGSKQYWVYALVTEPSYVKCENQVISNSSTHYSNNTNQNIDILSTNETEYISAWDLLLDKVF